ncbi:MAG: 2Fe-2S iron-sulfur cluster binding domain-containing protein [Proteobacteria bacterium]|nr:2Fe-2S iron-sulfur cluster binding domain-containing protein [Pseudomonadota bacterium]
MSLVTLRVNGEDVRADIPPRTHLADFLREHRLLTGTHLGCEHGVCGACTLLIEGAPARSCIAYAAACDGASVTTIEGLEHDPVMEALRAAFTAEHALQCGYCTPGMLVTARDIVLRLPDADADRIRLELAGNLCRCTGYAGIVRAIQRVLREGVPAVPRTLTRLAPLGTLSRDEGEGLSPPPSPSPASREREGPVAVGDGRVRANEVRAGGNTELTQTLRLSLPPDQVWAALQDPALIASCIPGAAIASVQDGRIEGTMEAALGPMRARFAGAATVRYGTDRTGTIEGEGQDRASATRLSGSARFAVLPDGASGSVLEIVLAYILRGPLAQFARGAVVQDFAAEIAYLFARNLEARMQGRAAAPAASLGLFALLWRVLRRRLARLLGREP